MVTWGRLRASRPTCHVHRLRDVLRRWSRVERDGRDDRDDTMMARVVFVFSTSLTVILLHMRPKKKLRPQGYRCRLLLVSLIFVAYAGGVRRLPA
jgi:hypothetical protein